MKECVAVAIAYSWRDWTTLRAWFGKLRSGALVVYRGAAAEPIAEVEAIGSALGLEVRCAQQEWCSALLSERPQVVFVFGDPAGAALLGPLGEIVLPALYLGIRVSLVPSNRRASSLPAE